VVLEKTSPPVHFKWDKGKDALACTKQGVGSLLLLHSKRDAHMPQGRRICHSCNRPENVRFVPQCDSVCHSSSSLLSTVMNEKITAHFLDGKEERRSQYRIQAWFRAWGPGPHTHEQTNSGHLRRAVTSRTRETHLLENIISPVYHESV
jgi:hypothetical protein